MTTSFSKTLSVIEALSCADEPMSIARLAEITGVNRVSISRMLTSLSEEGYVFADETGRYRPTLAVLSTGIQVLAQRRTREIAFPFLVDLSADVGTEVSLGFLQYPEIVFIETVFVIGSRVSSRLTYTTRPLLESHTGRMLVAMASDAMFNALITEEKAMDGIDDHPTEKSLREELLRAREDGYIAFDRNRVSGSPAGISVPIFDYTGSALSGLIITRPTGMDDVFLHEALPKAIDTSRSISSALGSRRTFLVGNM